MWGSVYLCVSVCVCVSELVCVCVSVSASTHKPIMSRWRGTFNSDQSQNFSVIVYSFYDGWKPCCGQQVIIALAVRDSGLERLLVSILV